MKLLLDQGTPRSSAALLREHGFDAMHTAEAGLAEAEDPVILARASAEDRVVVTLDADFHAHLALSGATRPSVIRIRVEGLRAEPLVELLRDVLERCEADLNMGAMVSVQKGRIRIRHLPILKSDAAI
jgi:predicted nuclease of predicted toxin-antitoxin system